MPESVAVVIPTWNEAGRLPELWQNITSQIRVGDEIILADAGSPDGTAEVARQLGWQVCDCPRRGRGHQIASALDSVTSDVIMVLHADTWLEPGSMDAIRETLMRDPKCPGGCLGHRFDRSHWMLKLVEWGDELRVRVRGVSFGDQVQFFRNSRLQSVGGFPRQSIMEDFELSRRLNQLGRPIYLNRPAITSARRFERLGIWNTLRKNASLRRQYDRLGSASCDMLFHEYYHDGSQTPATIESRPRTEANPVTPRIPSN